MEQPVGTQPTPKTCTWTAKTLSVDRTWSPSRQRFDTTRFRLGRSSATTATCGRRHRAIRISTSSGELLKCFEFIAQTWRDQVPKGFKSLTEKNKNK
ncbi:hypothetical protein GE061_017918 [Apolygus lucorum]|uniref:Uncharacterized protein n=1 Tax=Apolygus lucorum TaxID=248454 RepID=A0A6A4JDX5_APOLU|nr:hypothetical protein GE061_017918 [Apolygus lucorum]